MLLSTNGYPWYRFAIRDLACFTDSIVSSAKGLPSPSEGCLNYARINPPSKTFQLEISLDPLFRKLFVLAQTFEHTKVLAGWTFS